MGLIRGILKTLLVIMAGLLCSFAALAAQPDWVDGDAAAYPGDKYLIGRGVGSTEDEAQNRARGDLATIFEVRVEVVTANTTTMSKKGNQQQVDTQATQRVSAKSDKVISGITIAELWRDPKTMTYHALAILSRAQAGASLRDEIGKIDDTVQLEINAAAAASDPLRRIAALNRATEATIKRDGFQASFKVVNPSGHGVDTPFPQAVVQAKMADALQQIRVATEVKADAEAREFADILKGGVATAGFKANDPDQADYVLTGKLNLTDLGRQNNWYWIRGIIEVSLIERGSGYVRGSKTWPIKASALDAKTARSRALIEVEKLLKQELRATIIGFASSY